MHEELKELLSGFIVNNVEIPVSHIRYKGKSKKYITWMIISDSPALSADDEVEYSVVMLDIHIFSDENYLEIEKELMDRMKSNDWVWTENGPELYEIDTGLYHKVITFEKERSLSWRE